MIALLHKTMSGQQLSSCMSSASFKAESAPQSTAYNSVKSKLSHNRAYSSLLVVLLATLLLSGLFFMSLSTFSAQSAFALTTNKATAKSNQTEGNGVIGGKETRLTWEGTVEDEQVSQLVLELPESSDLQSATTKVTVLSGLTREKIQATVSVQGTQVVISFSTPVDAQKLIRVEISGMKFPADGGLYTVEGTYTTEQGTQKLASSPEITIISNTPVQALVNWLDAQPWVEANLIVVDKLFDLLLDGHVLKASTDCLFSCDAISRMARLSCNCNLCLSCGHCAGNGLCAAEDFQESAPACTCGGIYQFVAWNPIFLADLYSVLWSTHAEY